jgi:hypothetical protein
MRIAAGLLLLALAGCVPLPESSQRQLTSEGVRPGAGSEALDRAKPVGEAFRYSIATPLRSEPSEMTVTFRRGDGGRYLREEIVRISEKTAPEAKLIAAMVRQRDGRQAEIVGSDVILRAADRIDRRGRTRRSDRDGLRVSYQPHDCRATLGECRAVRTDPDGRPSYLLVRTGESGGIWHEQVRHDPARDPQGRTDLLTESFYSLDANGVLVDMNRIDHGRDLGSYQENRRGE